MSISISKPLFNLPQEYPNTRQGVIAKLATIQSTYLTEIIREYRSSSPAPTQGITEKEIDQAKLAKIRAAILSYAFNGIDIPSIKKEVEQIGMPKEMVIPALEQFKSELDKGIKTTHILFHLMNFPFVVEAPDVLTMPPNANEQKDLRPQHSVPDVLAAPPNASSRLHLPRSYDI